MIISLFNGVHYLKHLKCMFFDGKKSGSISVPDIILNSFGKVWRGEDVCVVALCFRISSHFLPA